MERESSPHELARLAGLARLGRGLPGSFGALSRLIAEMLGPFDLADVRLRYPTRIFERELELQVGGRAVRLHVLGPAHTSSDTIAYLPDVRVVFAADLLFVGAIPVMWHGPTSSWLAALATMLTLDAEVFVPGHGDIAGRAGVESMQRFLRWLREAVEAYRERSRSALSITEELIRSSGFEEWRTWECPERLLISVVSVMRELSGEGPMTVTPAVRARLFRQIAVLKKRIEGG